MTTQEFAAKIKAKYPVYANIPDDQLVQKITAKYPQYKAQISDTSGTKQSPNPVGDLLNTFGLGAVSKGAKDFSQGITSGTPGGVAKSVLGVPSQPVSSPQDIVGLASNLIGEGAVGPTANILEKGAKIVAPRFASGAMLQASQPGSNIQSDITSGGLNVVLPSLVNKATDIQNAIAFLGKGGLGDINKEIGKPLMGGYKKIADTIDQFTQPIKDRITKIFDSSGGLSRAEMQKAVQNAVSGSNKYLNINKDVKDFVEGDFAKLIKDAGDTHFQEQLAKGNHANHVINPNPDFNPQPNMGSATMKEPGQSVNPKYTSSAKPGTYVKKGTEGAVQLGNTGKYVLPGTQSPLNPQAVASAIDPNAQTVANSAWHKQPIFQQSAATANAWGNENTPIPLHVWDDVRKNLGSMIDWSKKSADLTPVEKFVKSAYHSIDNAVKSKMTIQDATEYSRLRDLQSKAAGIKKSSQIMTSGKGGMAAKAAGIGEFAGLIPALSHIVGPASAAYALTRPTVSTASKAVAQSPIGSALERILGSSLSQGVSNLIGLPQSQ